MIDISFHIRKGSPHFLVKIIGGGIKIAVPITALRPIMHVRAVGIEPCPVQVSGLVQKLRHPFMSLPGSMELISKGQHHKGRMICQHPDDLAKLALIIGKALLRLKGIPGIPVGKFRLHQYAHLIRRKKSGLRRTVGMKPHTVNPVGFVGFQYVRPFLHGHGTVSRLRKLRTVRLASKKNCPPVQRQPSICSRREIPDSKGNCRFFTRYNLRRQLIQPAFVFVPAPYLCAERQVFQHDLRPSGFHAGLHSGILPKGLRPDAQSSAPRPVSAQIRFDRESVPMRINPHGFQKNRLLHAQTYKSQNAVPIGLCLIRSRRRIRDRIMGQPRIAVIRNQSDLMLSLPDIRKLIHMRRADGGLHKIRNLHPIHQQPQNPGPLRLQKKSFPLRQGKGYAAGKPCLPLIGMLSGKPCEDRAVSAKFLAKRSESAVRMPLVFASVMASDLILVQCSRKLHAISLSVTDIRLPFPCQ